MAATYINNTKLSLKIMVDVKAKKVVFAEASKEFVDFIFSLTSLPLSTVTKVLQRNGKGMVGCIGNLCKAIEFLGSECLEPNANKHSVLKPKATVTVPLLSLHECYAHRSKVDVERNECTCTTEVTYAPSTTYGHKPSVKLPQYVKSGVVYMVMDDLVVSPMSIALIKSHVEDLHALEEKQVQVGLQEALAILKASFETTSVLTTVFLTKI